MIQEPQFDKIAAKAVLELHLGIPLPVFQFWDDNVEPTEEILRIWKENNVVPIDIGNDKYHTRGTGSALESIVIDFAIPKTPALQILIDLVNKNNQTGFLKGNNESIVWTLREMHDLGYDPKEVVEAVGDVVAAFLNTGTVPNLKQEFTVTDYSERLAALGLEEPVVKSRSEYFRTAYAKAKAEQKRARLDVDAKRGFKLNDFGKGVHVALEKNDRYLRREIVRRHQLVVFRNPSGHAAIQGRGFDLTQLADELKRREPGIWFFDNRLPAMLNSSKQYTAIPPTGLSDNELVQLVLRRVPAMTANVQQNKNFHRR
ncbi:MAG: hypothetical protein ABR875_00565 [Minisyncoccia bacterium]